MRPWGGHRSRVARRQYWPGRCRRCSPRPSRGGRWGRSAAARAAARVRSAARPTSPPISRLPGRRARPRDRRRRRSGCGSHPRCCLGRGRPSPPPTTRRSRRAASTAPRPVLPPCDARAVTTPWPHRAAPSVNTTLRKRQTPRPGRTGTPGEPLPAPRCPTVPCVADVLIIEDDATIRSALVRALTARSHSTMTSPTAMDGLQSLVAHRPDVVLLDLGLPDLDGASLLAMIRSVSDVPVIVVSARDDGEGIVAVLDAGADDYLVKPFAVDQLDARIRAVLRRAEQVVVTGPVVVGGLVIDARSRAVALDGGTLDLSPKEFDLLYYLAERAGEVISKRELLAEVWHQPYGGADRTVDVHLHWLRRKLGETADAPRYLHRVRGVGLRLAAP